MQKKFSVALVIATYNWPEALKLVLESVLHQQVLPDELIIADDGSDASTKILIDAFRNKFTIPVKHFWHPDNGFQKTIILNQAIGGTSCDYIIEIDGDIVLHNHFVADHMAAAEKGYYVRGSRVLIGAKKSYTELATGKLGRVSPFSISIKNRFNAMRLPMLSPLIIKKSQRSDNVMGCNCAFWRKDFVKVNGYNNEIKGWGHEDIELAARFINAGLKQKKIKLMAVCYHLHHRFVERQRENVNYNIYERTLNLGITFCPKGYNQYNYS